MPLWTRPLIPSTADVLEQARLVEAGLDALGIPHSTVAVEEGRVWERAAELTGAVVCNLLESPPGRRCCSRRHRGAGAARAAFTGSPAAALWLTTDKLATRGLLSACGLPVAPGGARPRSPGSPPERAAAVDPQTGVGGRFGWAGAAGGGPNAGGALARARVLAARFPGQPILLEHFLPGREFNVSLLEGEAGVERCRWRRSHSWTSPPGSASRGVRGEVGHGLVRGEPHGAALSRRGALRALAEVRSRAGGWSACGLSGYGRVDLRLDEAGLPGILEVNANPCLSADAGFMAAASQRGLSPATWWGES